MFPSCQELAILYLILRHQQLECDRDSSAKILVKSDLSSECRALWYNSGAQVDPRTDNVEMLWQKNPILLCM